MFAVYYTKLMFINSRHSWLSCFVQVIKHFSLKYVHHYLHFCSFLSLHVTKRISMQACSELGTKYKEFQIQHLYTI